MRPLVSRTILATWVWAWAAWGHDFMGSESCEACHADAWAAWQVSAHARSREVLSASQQKDARCVSCHSPNEAEQRVAQVSCETCHGGGQYYSARYVMKDGELARLAGLLDPTEKSCRGCHDASSPSLRPFDFKEKLKAIDHWSLERKKRAQKAQGAVVVGPVDPVAQR
jgi:hypothetical protein